MHWINFAALTVLLMSGFQIFNAHPSLDWGKSSYSGRQPVLRMSAARSADGSIIGRTDILGREYRTTGWFGASKNANGEMSARGFPSWLTIPSTQWLALARQWHFFFAWIFVANGVLYVAYTVLSRHLARDLAPTKQDWRSVGRSVLDHVRFRHPTGEAAKRYNILQKVTYLVVIFGLLPFMILMGLAMSPRLDTLLPGWIDWFGGRQSARTLHFMAAILIVLFVLVHVFEVIVSGLWNNIRSMITGRYDIENAHASNALTHPETEK